MTIEELYKWSVDNEVSELEIGLQYRDEEGILCGNTFITEDRGIEAEVCLDDDTGDEYILLS